MPAFVSVRQACVDHQSWSIRQYHLWRLLRLRLLAVALAFLAMAAFLERPVLSQAGATEDELERLSRELAIKAVSASVSVLRWSPNLFPLRVAFSSGEELKKINCPEPWQRQFEEYVQFINTQQPLLRQTAITASELDAFIVFGPYPELESTAAYRLALTWTSKPDVRVEYGIEDPYNHSFLQVYGAHRVIRFSARFREFTSAGFVGPCKSGEFDVNQVVGTTLLQEYAGDIDGRLSVLYGEQTALTLAWRAHRRLLSAMRKLPNSEMSSRATKSALIEMLSSE